ncbi:hypothetical protein [Clostridium moutaii]|uniref:hypothetical protein n=1 Tax=Clostridium moutaii TaxID=3240932 RepID=UPI0035108184
MSNGLAFAEDEEMEMLSAYAKKGWMLYKFGSQLLHCGCHFALSNNLINMY